MGRLRRRARFESIVRHGRLSQAATFLRQPKVKRSSSNPKHHAPPIRSASGANARTLIEGKGGLVLVGSGTEASEVNEGPRRDECPLRADREWKWTLELTSPKFSDLLVLCFGFVGLKDESYHSWVLCPRSWIKQITTHARILDLSSAAHRNHKLFYETFLRIEAMLNSYVGNNIAVKFYIMNPAWGESDMAPKTIHWKPRDKMLYYNMDLSLGKISYQYCMLFLREENERVGSYLRQEKTVPYKCSRKQMKVLVEKYWEHCGFDLTRISKATLQHVVDKQWRWHRPSPSFNMGMDGFLRRLSMIDLLESSEARILKTHGGSRANVSESFLTKGPTTWSRHRQSQ
uniref:ULP_PROTEASE domain-containing protein n=1 Tax=Steinernema glaseri TaxID=37863 RepID=A0A1I7ZP71_9BILA